MVTDTQQSPWVTQRERQPERTAKKEAVLLAAARLFTRQGFAGTSLDDIAHSLGVTKPTLYYYIENKEQILFECVERGLAALRAGMAEHLAQGLGGRDRLTGAMALFARIATSDFGLCVIRVGEDPLSDPRRRALRALKGQVDTEFRGLIEQGMHEGWIARGDAAVAAFTVVGALSGVGRWYRPDVHGADSLDDAIRHCIDMLMRGVLGEPGRPASAITDRAGRVDQAQHTVGEREGLAAALPPVQHELHEGQRVLRCFVRRPANVAQMLEHALAQWPEAEALVSGSLRLSWRELHHAAARCAGGLSARGVQVGDRVAVYLGNEPEFVITCLACAWMGAVLVPVSARASAAELGFALNDSGAVAVVCSQALAHLLPAAAAAPQLRLRLVTGTPVQTGFVSFSSLMRAAPQTLAHAAGEDELAVLMYTSGTTGQPKGAMVSHLNIVHSVMHLTQAMGLGAAERTVVAVPLSHVTGLVAQLYTLLHCGGCLVLMAQFKAADFVQLAAQERMSCVIMVPAMYNLCLLLPDLPVQRLSNWRIGAYGGASMPTATIAGLAERLPGLVLMNAYGATETCSPATIMPRGETDSHRDSVGRAVRCGELCVMDDAGREVPRGQAGEIWIAGPMVVSGYWQNADATASEFRGGYWRSGDIGSIDADGYVRILDRKKDVIIRGGYKVFCVVVESALAEHPQVVEAALVGVPCAVLGERVHAHVCVRSLDDSTHAQALQSFCAARVADYAVPETWTIGTEPLPRNLNGKIVKRELRQSLHAALI
jgi:long-chain acyl-CoA synthetase